MPRSIWISLGLLVACNGSESSLPPPHDTEASWRVRCEAPDEPCDYPIRTVSGSIGPDDPGGLYVTCYAADGALDVGVGKVTVADPSGTVPGYAMSFDVGYDPATGFDLSRCAVLASEDDGRLWGGSCSAAAPGPGFPCQLSPTLVDGTLAATLRCVDLPSIPFQAGRDASLADGGNPDASVTIQISGCDA